MWVMAATILAYGKLFRDPERRVSRSDRSFAMATIMVGQGDDRSFWRVFAFADDAAEELMSRRKGDSIAVSGVMKAEIYSPEGKPPSISFTVTADRLISHRRTKRAAPAESRRAEPARRQFAPDDAVPF